MKPLLAAALLLVACQRSQPPLPRIGPEFLAAGAGPVDQVVRTALTDAVRTGRRLLVYVSATWCEPCQRFHKAVRAGELDASFPQLSLLEFDQDRDQVRLEQAGYDGN